MHWVDMQWLWGYHVLPGSIRDMLDYCRELGIKGGVNFDGVGYEKLAAEDPEALQLLREAVREGLIEPVGCSYGQPYGLFHGGESNVRQLIYGARSARRLLGVWPKTFWEEEFYFFPQLPQMLAGCGFTGASLYFQWTWHTPEVPVEDSPVIWWEGHDGTRILAATRNKLNLHQWPEDVDTMLASMMTEADVKTMPLVQQWVELMPSKDWMCRSEVLIPKIREFLQDDRFEVVPMTLGEYLQEARAPSPAVSVAGPDIPVCNYSMDQVWHGLTLGKNGDDMRHRSREAESAILLAETLSTMTSLLGRPYAQWDVYPTWELEEAWRELLAAQHHDNDECEGLCGRFGKRQYERALAMANNIIELQMDRLFPDESVVFPEINQFGWRTNRNFGRDSVPPLSLMPFRPKHSGVATALEVSESGMLITQGVDDRELVATYDLAQAGIVVLKRPGGPNVVPQGRAMGTLYIGEHRLDLPIGQGYDEDSQYCLATYDAGGADIHIQLDRASPTPGLTIDFGCWGLEDILRKVSPGFKGALTLDVPLFRDQVSIFSDTAYAVCEVGQGSSGVRKYPEGDWMTSAQWFEEVTGAFVAQNFVDIVDPSTGEGVLVAHRGNQQWFRVDGALRCVLSAEDPWDESYYRKNMATLDRDLDRWKLGGEFSFVPHGPISHAERWKIAQEFRRKRNVGFWSQIGKETGRQVRPFSFAEVGEENVVIAALYREEAKFAGRHVDGYAFPHARDGHANRGRDARATLDARATVEHPIVMRLVELDGIETTAHLTVTGQVAKVFKTNLLGQVEEEISATIKKQNCPQRHPQTGYSSTLQIPMRANEIATIYLDIVEGRKVARDLDAKREVWAQVHRT